MEPAALFQATIPQTLKAHLHVVERDRRIDANDIDRLLLREIDALVIRDFYPNARTTLIGTRLLAQCEPYANAPGVERCGGMAYFETVGDAALRRKYVLEAPKYLDSVRVLCEPEPHPIDLVRVKLDEAYPAGLRLLRNRHRGAMFAGLIRAFGPGAGAEPHVDDLHWDDGGDLFENQPAVQLSGNVYLAMPSSGGELCLWAFEPNRETHEALRAEGSYGLRIKALGPPAVRIKPEVGDLVLFRSRTVHAVSISDGGPRLAASFFLVAFEEGGTLFIYS